VKKEVTIWSEGVRLAADLFIPDDLKEDQRRPAILLCHGWAGPKSHLSATYAPFFCEAGFVCLTFDYRGWYESDARLVTMDKQPKPDGEGLVSVRARPVLEVVDALDQNFDIYNCLDFLMSEPSVDPDRLALWGSSFGGSHVVHVAAHDKRIKAVVTQVPAGIGSTEGVDGYEESLAGGYTQGCAKARGEIEFAPRPPGIPESLKGAADLGKNARYNPGLHMARINVPILILDQEIEEYGGIDLAGSAIYKTLRNKNDVVYKVFSGTHYDIYEKNYKEGSKMARDWFVEYLKP
jgi:uncharacterized protein